MVGTLDAPVIIDWGDAARGAPAADVARTWSLLIMGKPPGHAGADTSLTAIGRGILTGRYLAVHCHATSQDPARLDDWKFVRAAARFAEEIEVEYPKLLRLLEKRA